MSTKMSNLNVTKKNNIFKTNSQGNKKQAVRAELTSASRLKQRLPKKCYTSMKLDKFPSLQQISTKISCESVKSASALPLTMQRTSNQKDKVHTVLPLKQSTEVKEKSSLVTPLKEHNEKTRAHSTLPSSSKQWICDQKRTHLNSLSLSKQNNAIIEINISASQSPVSGQSVSDSNDTLSSFLSHSNSVEYNMSKCDIENSNVENSQKNNHNDECVHSSNNDSNVENLQKNNRSDKSVHSSSDDSNKDFGHNNEVEAPEKIIGMDMVKNLVYMVKVVKETQRNHGILLEEIVQRLRNKGITISHPEGMPQISLQNISTAEKMEKCLALSTAQMEYLTKRLSTEGGTSVEECVDRIMKKLLTRAVGSLYSYTGRKQKGKGQKFAFSPTNMCKVVKDAVLLVYPDANGRIIDKAIMDYLRYSPFRSSK